MPENNGVSQYAGYQMQHDGNVLWDPVVMDIMWATAFVTFKTAHLIVHSTQNINARHNDTDSMLFFLFDVVVTKLGRISSWYLCEGVPQNSFWIPLTSTPLSRSSTEGEHTPANLCVQEKKNKGEHISTALDHGWGVV